MRRLLTSVLLAAAPASSPAWAQANNGPHMMDKNSDQIAELIDKWLVAKGLSD